MRAVVHDSYGPPDVLRLADVEQPVPANDEVLVKVHATTVNRTDCGVRAGHPFFGLMSPTLRCRRQPACISHVSPQLRWTLPLLPRPNREDEAA